LRVQLVTAGPGDTAESLAARMVVANRPVERFLVLNGLERGAALKPGARYKIIAE
jgi:predicted Zn-dependent protease